MTSSQFQTLPTTAQRNDRHARDLFELAARNEPHSERDQAVFDALEDALRSFVSSLPIGSYLFAQDFTNHLDAIHFDLPSSFDLRRTSGLWRRLVTEKVIARDGIAPNGGGERSHSTYRTRYRVLPRPTHPHQERP